MNYQTYLPPMATISKLTIYVKMHDWASEECHQVEYKVLIMQKFHHRDFENCQLEEALGYAELVLMVYSDFGEYWPGVGETPAIREIP